MFYSWIQGWNNNPGIDVRDRGVLFLTVSNKGTVVYCQNHQINDIRWFGHPVKFDDKNIFLFATASNDRSARVFSCSRDKVSNVHPNPPLCVENIVTFVGHQKPTVQVAWHPNKQDVLLASASRDGTANVWDVIKKSPT